MDRRRDPRSRRRRAVRGLAAAAVSTLIAATAHTLSGGVAPVWLVVAAMALTAPIAVWLVGRSPSTLRTAVAVTVSQALFHAFFAITAGADPGVSPAHDHGVVPGLIKTSVDAHLHVPSAPMLAAHLVAAGLTTLALVHGERVLAAVARGIRRLLPPLFAGSPLHPRGRAVVTIVSNALRPSAPLFSLSRRGPPASRRLRTP